MYRLSKDDVKLLNNLLLMKDLNPEDGYSKEKVINKCSYFLFLSYLFDVYIINEVANCISDIIISINLVNRFIDFFVRSISCYLVTILSTKYHLFIGLMN